MKATKTIIGTIIATLAVSLSASATSYSGNGSSAWGGAIGLGTLTLTDNGTTVYGSLVTGGNLNGNTFVLYLQTGAGGFNSTIGFNDSNDQLRSAISQYTATGNGGGVGQSILDFASGFAPNYAIAMQPDSGINFGGLWQLANGGANSLNYINSVNVSPTGVDTMGTYTFSFNLSDVGLTAGQSFELFGMQISQTGYSSPEALGGNLIGTAGWGGTQTEVGYGTYTTTPVPEPSTLAICGLSGLAALLAVRRKK
ncbi:MAG: PEP-CTERM sorting domain-containing protein [Limisphaerales bacterium]